jgi:hypothetical protein
MRGLPPFGAFDPDRRGARRRVSPLELTRANGETPSPLFFA